MDEALMAVLRQHWADAAGVTTSAFSEAGLHVTPAPQGRTTPPGWFGAITIGGRVLVTAPDQDAATTLTDALATAAVTNADQLLQAVTAPGSGVAKVLGPAWLSCASAGEAGAALDAARAAAGVEPLVSGARGDLQGLIHACSREEVQESAVEGLSGVHVVRLGGAVVAAAGWEEWPGGLAHMGVLAAPSARGRGLAVAVSAAAVSAALQRGLLVQWRARPMASRRLALRLGLVEVGWQLSWR